MESEVNSGLYQTASEVIRAGLRRLKQDQQALTSQTPTTLATLEGQLLDSIKRLDPGEGVDGQKSLRRMRKRIKESGKRG